ncbi:MAG: uroporphyrinogen decarboxylase family protein [Armatimonadota bacterium]
MTARERTLRALSFEAVDRPPVAGGLLQNADFLAEMAGADDFWAAPRQHVFEAFRRMGCDAILGPVLPKPPDSTTRDAHGRSTDFTKREAAPEFTTPEQVAEYALALPAASELRRQFDAQKAYGEYVELMRRGQEEAGDMLLIPHCLGYAPSFPTSDGQFSQVAFLMACRLHTDEVGRLFRHRGEQSRLRLEAVARATIEQDLLRLLWIGSDICDARGPVLSPELLERLYFPAVRRAIEPLKDAGIRVVWHADANYRLILPRMIELGIDGFQGFYETEDGVRLEDLAQMRARSGDPLILFGSISTAWVLPTGTVGDVRHEVERCVEAAGNGTGLLLAPSSSIGPEVPSENVLAMYDHARAYVPTWARGSQRIVAS